MHPLASKKHRPNPANDDDMDGMDLNGMPNDVPALKLLLHSYSSKLLTLARAHNALLEHVNNEKTFANSAFNPTSADLMMSHSQLSDEDEDTKELPETEPPETDLESLEKKTEGELKRSFSIINDASNQSLPAGVVSLLSGLENNVQCSAAKGGGQNDDDCFKLPRGFTLPLSVPRNSVNTTTTATTATTAMVTGINPPPNVRVGVGVLLKRLSSCKVIAGIRSGSHGAGTLALPGGHLEFGESWESCARREVLEETGVSQITGLKLLHVTNDPMLGENKHYVTLFMAGVIDDGAEVNNLEPNKCEGWEEFTLDDLRTSDKLFGPLKMLVENNPAELATFLANQKVDNN